MWSVVPSLGVCLQELLVVFTQPSLAAHCQIVVGWLMCLGNRTEFRVFEAIRGQRVSRRLRHPFDRFYNFFSRSAWRVGDLAHQVTRQVVLALQPTGQVHLIVDATLLHKSGHSVWGIGWFHDPVASTEKRAMTALANKWVVLALAVRIPGTQKSFCLPIHAMLQQSGPGQPAEAELARRMLQDVLSWFPNRQILLVGDGGFSAQQLLRALDQRVRYVGLMRSDAALHETQVPPRRSRHQGPTPKYGPRLPSPCQVAERADQGGDQRWQWQTIEVDAYGQKRRFQVCAFGALWPTVFGQRPIQVVVCRSLDKGYGQVYLYTTVLEATAAWVIATYARRTAIEGTFKASKQVLEIQKPQHRCRQSIEKLAPWVWLMQSLVALWYLTEGRRLPDARAARRRLGPWETEWSYRHMMRLFRRLTIRQAINAKSHSRHDLHRLANQLENYLYLAA